MSRTSADPGLFSGADAAILAAAFRSQLRKPDFTERPVEEESESPGSRAIVEQSEVLLGRELAEEGRDIRSVDSSRGVRVETLSFSKSKLNKRTGGRFRRRELLWVTDRMRRESIGYMA